MIKTRKRIFIIDDDIADSAPKKSSKKKTLEVTQSRNNSVPKIIFFLLSIIYLPTYLDSI